MHDNLMSEIVREILKGCHMADEYARMVGARVYIPSCYIIQEDGKQIIVPIDIREIERFEKGIDNGKETS